MIAQFVIHEEILPNILYINQVVTKRTVYLRCTAQFCTFRTEFFTTHLKRTFKCAPNKSFFVFFLLHYLRSLCLFGKFLDRSYIPRKKKKRGGTLTSILVPETSGSSVRLPYSYPESTNPTEHNLKKCSVKTQN